MTKSTLSFPPFPANSQKIYDYRGDGERMACTIVHNCTIRQLLAYRKLRLRLGEMRFREVLVVGLDILAHSTTITSPAAWLYRYVKGEADNA